MVPRPASVAPRPSIVVKGWELNCSVPPSHLLLLNQALHIVERPSVGDAVWLVGFTVDVVTVEVAQEYVLIQVSRAG